VQVVINVPRDVRSEFGSISESDWQLMFSRFVRQELEEIRDIESIISKSEMTEKQAKLLADEVSLAISRRLTGK